MAVVIVLIIVALIVVCGVSGYNRLVRMRNQCDEAFSTMDVYLKKRADLIPNLVSAVKGYAAHETQTLTRLAERRAAATGTAERLDSESRLSGTIRQVLAVAESYPELKANTNFLNLQQQLGKTEEDIATARRYYNGCVKQYNDGCMAFPGSLIASLFHFAPQALFTASEADSANVKVEF